MKHGAANKAKRCLSAAGQRKLYFFFCKILHSALQSALVSDRCAGHCTCNTLKQSSRRCACLRRGRHYHGAESTFSSAEMNRRVEESHCGLLPIAPSIRRTGFKQLAQAGSSRVRVLRRRRPHLHQRCFSLADVLFAGCTQLCQAKEWEKAGGNTLQSKCVLQV